ncbi:hypothetical protein MMC09_001292 [Bachmanniomyces sp. S44760]|nr:hypothetical protein [Bachmanniomyces sp. S44760]
MTASLVSLVQHVFRNLIQLPSSLVAYFQASYQSRVSQKVDGRSSEPASVVIEDPVKCRYRLDNDSSATLTLPDGRKLGYAQYGLQSDKAHAILYLHGLPGARLEIAFLDEIATRLEARIIAVDRPGYGWSSPHPNRTIRDHVKDVEYLAEQLELESYAALGISGGGPYVLACARYLPADKLKAVSIVCGLGPPDIGYRGQNWIHWLGFTLGWPYTPLLGAWFVGQGLISRLDLTDKERLERFQRDFSKTASKTHPKDVAFFGNVDRVQLFLRTARESYAQGFDALAQDGHLVSTNFGFRVEDIRSDLPVQLWYGKLDTHVPLRHGEQIAARIGANAHLRIEDETHASIVLNCQNQIMEDLVGAMGK